MARRSFHATLSRIISGEQKKYGALFECTCAPLNRSRQPFRNQATEQIVADLCALIPPHKQTLSLVIAFHQPGGLLFEFILLNQLINQGFTNITVILIQKNFDAKALQSFKTWFGTTIKICLFKTIQDYSNACIDNKVPPCTALIAVDPDRASEIPQWQVTLWRKKWLAHIQYICAPVFYTATLFFQPYNEPFCHLTRTVIFTDQNNKNKLIMGVQQSGRFDFSLYTLFSYFNTSRLIPVSQLPDKLQIFPQNMVMEHQQLIPLFQFLQQGAPPKPLLFEHQIPALKLAFWQIQQLS